MKKLLIGFTVILLGFLIYKGSTEKAPEQLIDLPEETQSIYGLPMRLKIPSINVDTEVEYVGLGSDGAMGTPENAENVAWFEPGIRPGDIGSAVIAGHYGQWKNGEGSVFDDLSDLKEGDILYVEDEYGATTAFIVREKRKYDPNADAAEVFASDDGESHLNLITCEGVWDEVTQNYSERLVIFTDLDAHED